MPKNEKTFELIYSRQKTDFIPGRAYSNPRFYIRPREGVTKVLIVGDWPRIEADYKALGVPVERLDTAPVSSGQKAAQSAPAASAALRSGLTDEERAAVKIPEDWQSMRWFAQRNLAQKFSAAPVLNKDGAVAAVEAELARRGASESDPAEETGSNGLTRREMHADLESAKVEIDPSLGIEDLVTKHAEVKAAA
jgi:hypothetical protein